MAKLSCSDGSATETMSYLKARWLDRYCYVLDLQSTSFWVGLNDLWRSGGDEQEWRERYSVRDRWLVNIVDTTLEMWRDYPESDRARLSSDQWFAFPQILALPACHIQPQPQMEIVLNPSTFAGSELGSKLTAYVSAQEVAMRNQCRQLKQ